MLFALCLPVLDGGAAASAAPEAYPGAVGYARQKTEALPAPLAWTADSGSMDEHSRRDTGPAGEKR
jgi:hypothetical protein